MEPTVTPLSKARIQELSRLKTGRAGALILLEGPHLVQEAARVGCLTQILVADLACGLRISLQIPGVPVGLCRPSDFARIADVRTPQEVMGVGTPIQTSPVASLLQDCPRAVYLDAVQDPGNVGTIVRTGLGLAQCGFIFGRETADRMSPKVLRSSGGIILHARQSVVASHAELLGALHGRSHRLVTLDAHAGEDWRHTAAPHAFVLVAGNEGAGSSLPRDSSRELRLRIPLDPRVESLNVAISVAMVLARWA